MYIDKAAVLSFASWLRGVQTCVADSYNSQLMRCPVHLSIGQELLWAVIKQFKTIQLNVFSSHRGHLPYLTLDGNLKRYIAELHLHPDGVSGGKLGSMHIKSPQTGHVTSVPIVGSSIPLAVGASYACKHLGYPWLSVAHFGDGACEEGILHESLNLASTKSLPTLFLCENNGYSCTTALSRRQPSHRMARFAEAACIRSCSTTAQSLETLIQDVSEAFEYIINTRKPFFLEVDCYRLYEHCGASIDTNLGDRTKEEFTNAIERDYVTRFLDASAYDSGYGQCKALILQYTEKNSLRLKAGFR